MTPSETRPDRPCTINRVGIIGCGAVGATTAYAIIQGDAADHIVLCDVDLERAEGERMDISHSVPFARPSDLSVAPPEDVKDCDLVIVTAGVAQKEGESRLDLIKRNTEIYHNLFPLLSDNNPDALFLIVTNPVDIMARVALKLSGLPPARCFGSGTILDTARFRQLLSAHLQVAAAHVHALVIGEHGDSEVLAWSRTRVGPIGLDEYSRQIGRQITDDDRKRIDRDVRRAAYEIIERKGATNFAIGSACTSLVRSFADPKDSLYTLSRQVDGLWGIEGVCLSVPTLVNRGGAVKSLELKLNDREQEGLLRSAEVLDEAFQELKL